MHALSCLLSLFLLSSYGFASPIPNTPSYEIPSHCDLSSATLPLRGCAPELPPPSSHLQAKHVVLGVGTQNYSCAAAPPNTNSDEEPTKPVAIGALASLFDISCIVSQDPSRVDGISQTALTKVKGSGPERTSKDLSPELPPAGKHYFIDATPFFDFRLNGGDDNVFVAVAEEVPSPDSGKNNAVDWLQLTKEKGVGIEMVYRVETLGGKAPETCEGMGSSFEVPYVAQYWAYG